MMKELDGLNPENELPEMAVARFLFFKDYLAAMPTDMNRFWPTLTREQQYHAQCVLADILRKCVHKGYIPPCDADLLFPEENNAPQLTVITGGAQ